MASGVWVAGEAGHAGRGAVEGARDGWRGCHSMRRLLAAEEDGRGLRVRSRPSVVPV